MRWFWGFTLAFTVSALADQFIEVGRVSGDFDGDSRIDYALLLQYDRTWQIIVARGVGSKVLVDQISAPELTTPMNLDVKNYTELGTLPVLTVGPSGTKPVWYYQWNGHSFVDVSDSARNLRK